MTLPGISLALQPHRAGIQATHSRRLVSDEP